VFERLTWIAFSGAFGREAMRSEPVQVAEEWLHNLLLPKI
jgi:hypothetical protein